MEKDKLAEDKSKETCRGNAALNCHNDILLFTKSPGEAESSNAAEYFGLLQQEALNNVGNRPKKDAGTVTSTWTRPQVNGGSGQTL